MPLGPWSISPMRSRPGSAPTSSRKGRAGAGALYQASGSGAESVSRIAAASATVRVTAPSTIAPSQLWLSRGTRPRLGLRPTRPQQAAGIRIDPPPSLACAAGNIPPAVAAAAPPLDPPGDRSRSHGLCAGPKRRFSVAVMWPNSGVLVLQARTNPARANASTQSSLGPSHGASVRPREP